MDNKEIISVELTELQFEDIMYSLANSMAHASLVDNDSLASQLRSHYEYLAKFRPLFNK